ncbi:hypothetical protein [Oceaniferula spumae]|uniref:hypothetical protein n=1 Tax=Oceaniferula spumae TaxID=2979115 RepID=UPI003F4EA57B
MKRTLHALCLITMVFPVVFFSSTLAGDTNARDRCEVHNQGFKSCTGYTQDDNTCVDYDIEYSWYFIVAEARGDSVHYRAHLSSEPTEGFSKKVTWRYCQTCDSNYQRGYRAFMKLSVEEREKLFKKAMRELKDKQ